MNFGRGGWDRRFAAPSEVARLSDVFENKVGAIMVDRADSREIAKRAKELYEARWRAELERDHLHEFAAMELESATYFLGKSLSDAIRSARWVQSLIVVGSPVAPRQEAGQQDAVRLSFEAIRRSRLISHPVAERQGYLRSETRPS